MRNPLPIPPAALIDALRNKSAIAVVGAGLSQAGGGPSWGDLLLGIAFEAEQSSPERRPEIARSLKALKEGHPLDCASLLKVVLGSEFRRAACSQIKDVYKVQVNQQALTDALEGNAGAPLFTGAERSPRLLRPTRNHFLLTQLPFLGFVTTNYDCLLETALPGGEIAVLSRSSSRELAACIQDHRQFILKLHGDVHHVEDIVLAREDYEALLADETLRTSLQTLFRASKPFWVGYGLADPDLALVLGETVRLGLSGGYGLVRAANGSLRQRFEEAKIFPSVVGDHADTEAYLLKLAELSESPLRIRIVLDLPWPGSNQSSVVGESFVKELSRLADELLELESTSEGSIVLAVKGSTGAVQNLRRKLRNSDRALLGLFHACRVSSFDDIIVMLNSEQVIYQSKPSPEGKSTPPPIGGELGEGEVYPMALLSADVVRHSTLVRSYGPDLVRKALARIHELIRDATYLHGGNEFNWAGDGGVFAFWGEGFQTRAALAGIYILHDLSLFNLDPARNPLPVPIRLRVGSATGLVEFQTPTNTISANALNHAVHLQERGAEPNEFAITDALFADCNERPRTAFRYKGRFEGEPVYSVSLVQEQRFSREQLQALAQELDAQHEDILEIVADRTLHTSEDPQIHFDTIRAGIDQFFSILDDICRAVSRLDENWASAFFEFLGHLVLRCLEIEARLWAKLEHGFVAAASEKHGKDLHAILSLAGSRRAAVIPTLKWLSIELQQRSGAADPVLPTKTRLAERVQALLDADEIEQETAFVELLTLRIELKSYLTDPVPVKGPAADQREALARRLWLLADRLFLEQTVERRSNEVRLSSLLVSDPWVGDRFGSVESFLLASSEAEFDDAATIQGRLTAWSAQDLEIFWRCILISHSSQKIKELAVRRATMESLWLVVAYSKVSLTVLILVASRIRERESQENLKILFDCTRSRLATGIRTATSVRGLSGVRTLLMLFLSHDAFVRTGYFKRLDDLLRRFYDKLETLGEKDDLLREARATADAVRQQLGEVVDSTPVGLTELPKPVQRWLAKERPYFNFFVSHADYRIASEVLRNIEPGNLSSVLNSRSINVTVMEEILRQDGLFKRPEVVFKALNHPKCTPGFAKQYLPRVAQAFHRSQLERLVKNSGANATVRDLAKAALARVQVGSDRG